VKGHRLDRRSGKPAKFHAKKKTAEKVQLNQRNNPASTSYSK
jgi:hypothetical protein